VEGDGSWPTWSSLEPSGLYTMHPLYTARLLLETSSSLLTSVVPAEACHVIVISVYCFCTSGEMESSSHWVMETGTSRAWLTTLRMTAGSSMGVE
jgi:hypothetical protein